MEQVAYIRASNIFDDSRASKEIIALSEAGYFVSVFGWDRCGFAKKKCSETFIDNKNIDFYFYPVQILPGQGNSLKKIIGWINWLDNSLNKQNYDIVHACDLDSGISGYRYSKRNKCKLVYDIYDYYIDCHHVPSFTESFLEHYEIKIINYADLTIICTDERRKQICKSNPKRVAVIHNSPQVDSDNDLDKNIEYDYVYCGSLCDYRLLKDIFDDYTQHTNIKMAIAGTGEFAQIANELSNNHSNFYFWGTLPYSDVLSLEAKSSVISAIYDPTLRNHKLCAPNKFYEALALGKPIIVCKGTGIDEVVEKEQIGLVINYDSNEFYLALESLLSDKSLCLEMGRRARKLYCEKYKWEFMRDLLVDEYKKLYEEN